MAVELRNHLNRAFDGEYTASNTVVFDYPSVLGLASHLAGELGHADEPEVLPESPAQAQRSQLPTEHGGIAIVGMSCRVPGADDLSAFWHISEEGRNLVTDAKIMSLGVVSPETRMLMTLSTDATPFSMGSISLTCDSSVFPQLKRA